MAADRRGPKDEVSEPDRPKKKKKLRRLEDELAAVRALVSELAERLGRLESASGERDRAAPRVQAGILDLPPSGARDVRCTVRFPEPFSTRPVVVLTATSHPHDFIVLDTVEVGTEAFAVWALRLEGGPWDATQTVNWIAIEPS